MSKIKMLLYILIFFLDSFPKGNIGLLLACKTVTILGSFYFLNLIQTYIVTNLKPEDGPTVNDGLKSEHFQSLYVF